MNVHALYLNKKLNILIQNSFKFTVDEFPQGEPILVKTESHVIEGKVMTVGDIQVNNGTIRCVGVKFVSFHI